MPVPQITIRLSRSTKMQFEDYAKEHGLSASELAKLLIVRERNLQRLLELREANKVPSRPRRRRVSGDRLPTVTAHFSLRSDVENFDAYTERCGLNRNTAGQWLLETELEEKWLERALTAI